MAGFTSQAIIVVLVLSVFYVHLSSALVCWTCNPCPNPHDNSSSSIRAANCSSLNTICVKNTVRVLNQAAQISKGCVSSCTQSSTNSFGQGAFVDCCNTDYCNSSPRQQLSFPMYLLSFMAIGLIFRYHQ